VATIAIGATFAMRLRRVVAAVAVRRLAARAAVARTLVRAAGWPARAQSARPFAGTFTTPRRSTGLPARWAPVERGTAAATSGRFDAWTTAASAAHAAGRPILRVGARHRAHEQCGNEDCFCFHRRSPFCRRAWQAHEALASPT